MVFVGLVALFIAFFRITYQQDLSPLFSYMGLIFNEPSPPANIAVWSLALVPALFLRMELKQPSDFIMLLLYICVYIPSMFVPLFMNLQPEWSVTVLDLAILAGMMLMIWMLRGNSRPAFGNTPRHQSFWMVTWGLFVVFVLWILFTFGGSLRLVALTDVYSSGLRFDSRDIQSQSNVGYAVMMLYGAINPLLIALGLQNKKRLLIVAGIGGQLLCYSTAGSKVIIFSIGVILVLHLLVRRHMKHAAHLLMILSIVVLWGPHVAGRVFGQDNPSVIVLEGTMSRALVIPGQLTGEYHDFFVHHPHLYLSGTKPFSWVLSNPLSDDVIFAITEYYEGNDISTSNAHFWAQDGLANFGLFGVVAMSILTAFVLRVVDRISIRHDPCFASMAFSFAAFNLANAPLSIALLSGGLMLSMILVSMADNQVAWRFGREVVTTP